MFDVKAARKRAADLAAEVQAKMADPRLTTAQKAKIVDRAEAESAELQCSIKNYETELQFRAGNDLTGSVPLLNTKSVGKKWCPPSPLSASAERWESLFAAASSRLGGYTQRVGFDSKSVGLGDVRFKAPTVEGSPGEFVAVAADRPRLRAAVRARSVV